MTGILRAFEALVLDRRSPVGEEEQGQEKVDAPTGCTVLAIDDDPAILDIMRPLLREEGFNVLTSTSGPKGLDMIRYVGGDVRVVLLDYNMPQLNGAEVLQHLRRMNPNAKVIAVTGVNINLLPESFREGVDKFIQKPFRTADVISSIHELLGSTPKPQVSTEAYG